MLKKGDGAVKDWGVKEWVWAKIFLCLKIPRHNQPCSKSVVKKRCELWHLLSHKPKRNELICFSIHHPTTCTIRCTTYYRMYGGSEVCILNNIEMEMPRENQRNLFAYICRVENLREGGIGGALTLSLLSMNLEGSVKGWGSYSFVMEKETVLASST